MALKVMYTTGMASLQSGAYKIMLDMAQGMAYQGYEVILALPRNGKVPEQDLHNDLIKVQYVPLPFPRRNESSSFYLRYLLKNIQSIASLVRIIRREKVSIVHVNEIFDIYGAIAARLAGARCVWNVRAELSPWPTIRRFLPRLVMILADRVIVASESVRNETFSQKDFDQNRIHVLYDPGLDFTNFHPGVQGDEIRTEFGIRTDEYLVVLVAKLSERKGHEVLLRAIPFILELFPQTRFLFVGGELSGSHHRAYVKRLYALVQELDINDKVIFAGFRSDVPKIMAAADIVVHTSIYPDPFPGVVLQAMAVAKPVVASKLGGTLEQIENDVDGILVEADNPSCLADAICSLLQDEDKRLVIGQRGFKRVKSRFSDDKYFHSLRRIYDGLKIDG